MKTTWTWFSESGGDLGFIRDKLKRRTKESSKKVDAVSSLHPCKNRKPIGNRNRFHCITIGWSNPCRLAQPSATLIRRASFASSCTMCRRIIIICRMTFWFPFEILFGSFRGLANQKTFSRSHASSLGGVRRWIESRSLSRRASGLICSVVAFLPFDFMHHSDDPFSKSTQWWFGAQIMQIACTNFFLDLQQERAKKGSSRDRPTAASFCVRIFSSIPDFASECRRRWFAYSNSGSRIVKGFAFFPSRRRRCIIGENLPVFGDGLCNKFVEHWKKTAGERLAR